MRNADKTNDQLIRENAQLRKQLNERQTAYANHKQVKKALEEIEAKFDILTVHAPAGLFLTNMSHELRTPLNAIIGYSQLMQKNALPPTERRKYLNSIDRNSEHLLTLNNDIPKISKIESGQLSIEHSTFDVPALFGNLNKAFASSLDDKGLFFSIFGIEDVPRYVTADEAKQRQVLSNILGNATKFKQQGGITMRVAVTYETAKALRLLVEVQDTGIGIAEDELDNVFAVFDQTISGRAKKKRRGLGLAICRNDVRLMGAISA
jgi:signal transduction histidine kinase